MIDLLISDLVELVKVGKRLNNSNIRANNLKNSLDKQFTKLELDRSYKLKFPLNLIFKKIILNNVTNHEEIKNYDRAVIEYNKELDQVKRLDNCCQILKSEIGMLISELTLDDVKKISGISEKRAKEIYRLLKELPT